MPRVGACALENLMLAKKPEKLRANMKMACRWVLMQARTQEQQESSAGATSKEEEL